MKSTDKYYEIGHHLVLKAQSRIVEALSMAPEKHSLTTEDVNALGRLLAYRMNGGDDGGHFEHAVDYLWMSFRIEINQKMLLLDLLDNESE